MTQYQQRHWVYLELSAAQTKQELVSKAPAAAHPAKNVASEQLVNSAKVPSAPMMPRKNECKPVEARLQPLRNVTIPEQHRSVISNTVHSEVDNAVPHAGNPLIAKAPSPLMEFDRNNQVLSAAQLTDAQTPDPSLTHFDGIGATNVGSPTMSTDGNSAQLDCWLNTRELDRFDLNEGSLGAVVMEDRGLLTLAPGHSQNQSLLVLHAHRISYTGAKAHAVAFDVVAQDLARLFQTQPVPPEDPHELCLSGLSEESISTIPHYDVSELQKTGFNHESAGNLQNCVPNDTVSQSQDAERVHRLNAKRLFARAILAAPLVPGHMSTDVVNVALEHLAVCEALDGQYDAAERDLRLVEPFYEARGNSAADTSNNIAYKLQRSGHVAEERRFRNLAIQLEQMATLYRATAQRDATRGTRAVAQSKNLGK